MKIQQRSLKILIVLRFEIHTSKHRTLINALLVRRLQNDMHKHWTTTKKIAKHRKVRQARKFSGKSIQIVVSLQGFMVIMD